MRIKTCLKAVYVGSAPCCPSPRLSILPVPDPPLTTWYKGLPPFKFSWYSLITISIIISSCCLMQRSKLSILDNRASQFQNMEFIRLVYSFHILYFRHLEQICISFFINVCIVQNFNEGNKIYQYLPVIFYSMQDHRMKRDNKSY